MTPPTIAIFSPGAMGAAVAKRLTTTSPGLTVLTDLTHRSPASRKRAEDAGMQDASLARIVTQAAWVLSIMPPSEAEAFAKGVKAAYDETSEKRKLVFVDCNAVNPDTVKRIAGIFSGSPVAFVDAGIIGGPPSEGYDPVFYASANPQDDAVLSAFEGLGEYGLKISALRGEGAGVGDASALKMSYAGITKGTIGLFTTMILAAHASSPTTATALMHELAASQPFFLKRITTSVPGMLPKAYRWVGEMDEISEFVGGEQGKVHEGLARVYERVEGSLKGDGQDVEVLKKFVEDAKKVVEGK
ncbi:hypothetical protein EUX98_g5664 [Antrodiella citrinella]|uniref:Phosphogluconate dehydrogenase NAD-binding putative C-terminal domain-containing protein n=1 Tax=Antrodiella citrinella TaxID=2447956 RepID=A0A4V3XIA5_9APHY|nr:hypothetical protein EUX98_g5664 [Antrodiella citrinella]